MIQEHTGALTTCDCHIVEAEECRDEDLGKDARYQIYPTIKGKLFKIEEIYSDGSDVQEPKE